MGEQWCEFILNYSQISPQVRPPYRLGPPSSPARSRCWSSPPPLCSSSRQPQRLLRSTTPAAAIPTSAESMGESTRGSIHTRATTQRKTTGSRTTTATTRATVAMRTPGPPTGTKDLLMVGRGSSYFSLLGKLSSSNPALASVLLLDPTIQLRRQGGTR